MVASPEVDAVVVVVRVPSHNGPTKAAIVAGKQVFTEWPLGRTTAEAEELAALAKANGVQAVVGLQSRVSLALLYMKELIESAKGSQDLLDLPIPERFTCVPKSFPRGTPFNVGQMYSLFAESIQSGKSTFPLPSFDTAVELHRIIDSVRQSSDSRTTLSFAVEGGV